MHLLGSAVLDALGLFAGMVACVEIGYRFARGRSAADRRGYDRIGEIEAGIFGLLGLLLGFAFSGATGRLEARRQLAVDEANAISTAMLRIDVMPAAAQPRMRSLFRAYVDARIDEMSRSAADDATAMHSSELQHEIWMRAVAAGAPEPEGPTVRLVLPALNDMFDIATKRTVAAKVHVPILITGLLYTVALISAIIAGYAMGNRQTRSAVHGLIYATAIAATVYTILDLGDPSAGLIRLGGADTAMQELHDSIR
jgi:hypothetical protein